MSNTNQKQYPRKAKEGDESCVKCDTKSKCCIDKSAAVS
jgi:hypothetical protein